MIVLKATISFALNHYAYNDAIFLAERLHAEGLYHLFEHLFITIALVRVQVLIDRSLQCKSKSIEL